MTSELEEKPEGKPEKIARHGIFNRLLWRRLRTRLTWLWYDLVYAIIWIRYGFREPSLEELLTQDEIGRLRALIQEG